MNRRHRAGLVDDATTNYTQEPNRGHDAEPVLKATASSRTGANHYTTASLFIICLGSLMMNLNFMLMSTMSTPTSNEPTAFHTAVNIDTLPIHYDHGMLPGCDELMQNPSSPYTDGAFLTRKTTHVVWKMRHDCSRELTLPLTCRLKRYTAQQAGKCLANKSLLFIGDSLTRYQYLSLAYFLEHKKWPMRYQASGYLPCKQLDENNTPACSKPFEPNICCEYDWELHGNGGWPAFIQNLGGGTDGGLFHGRMEARSVRTKPSIEGYQYVSSAEDGRTKISFVSEFGWKGNEPFMGWDFSGCVFNATCRYPQESYDGHVQRQKKNDFDWNYPDITTAFATNTTFRTEYQNSSYIFYNRGLWGALDEDKAKTMMTAFRNMTGGLGEISNRCFFRSTTGSHRTLSKDLDSTEYGHIRTIAHESGCEYFDVAHVTEEFTTLFFNPKPPPMVVNEFKHVFWDALHYLPWVYEELNNLLLNVICNTESY